MRAGGTRGPHGPVGSGGTRGPGGSFRSGGTFRSCWKLRTDPAHVVIGPHRHIVVQANQDAQRVAVLCTRPIGDQAIPLGYITIDAGEVGQGVVVDSVREIIRNVFQLGPADGRFLDVNLRTHPVSALVNHGFPTNGNGGGIDGPARDLLGHGRHRCVGHGLNGASWTHGIFAVELHLQPNGGLAQYVDVQWVPVFIGSQDG